MTNRTVRPIQTAPAIRKLVLVALLALASLFGTLTTSVDVAPAESVHVPLPPPSGFPNPGVALAWPRLERGVALSQETFWDENQVPDVIEADALRFTGCRWLWLGRYAFDFALDETADMEFPARLRLHLFNQAGDAALGGWIYEVEVSGPGSFTMLLDNNQQAAFWRSAGYTGNRSWFHQGSPADSAELPGCTAVLYGPSGVERIGLGHLQPSIVLAPPQTSFGNSTLEALASSIDPTAGYASLQPLASLLSEADLPRFDRLYVAPNNTLLRIEVETEGTCIRITSDYERSVSVEQSRGCARPASKPANQRRVRDRIWRVVIAGPAQARASLRQDLTRFRAKSVPLQKQGGKPMRPGKWLNAVLEDTSINEIARFRWKSGFVSIINHGQGTLGRFADPIVATAREQQLGGSGGQCAGWTQYLQSAPSGGFAYIVSSEEITATLPTDSDPIEFAFVDARSRRVGFADLTGHPNINLSRLTVRDANGNPLGCDEDSPS